MPFVIGIIVILLTLYYFRSQADAHNQQDLDAEQELLQLCLGDRERADRLLKLEMSKMPNIKRGEALRRAIGALRRDAR